MRVSYKWLQDYVEVTISPEELADKLTLAGVAVDVVEKMGDAIENVVTGRIERVEKHPGADKLSVCHVTVREGEEPLQIVCGAPNVAAGQTVPVALVGAVLPGGLKIKRAKLRGVHSDGMICSAQELGMDDSLIPPDQRDGIMVLPDGTPLNWDIKTVLGFDDAVLVLDLTPNRGDCLSMVGVAREVAAILQKPLRVPQPKPQELSERIDGMAKVDIEAPDLCKRYAARLLKNVKVDASPLWMQQRLRACGIRPINNIVDVTNYVMMELGQPLHAFDYATLKNRHIIVRRAREGESLVTLDNVKRELTEDMLVITDPAGPVAVAGVMGGLDTEVTENTNSVLLESAYFDPVSIRRTSRKLGLRSDASNRFEKGIDIDGCVRAADRAAELIQEMGACEVVGGVVDNYPAPVSPKRVILRTERVAHILGTDIPKNEMADILTRLKFKVEEGKERPDGQLLVTVPTFRPDVSLEEDLVEEIARLYGYNKIENSLPYGATTRGKRTREQKLIALVKDILSGCGLSEVITYSFTSPHVFDRMLLPADSPLRKTVAIANPLSEEQSVMRTMLLPNLLEVLVRNYNRRVQNGAVFEIGSVFYPRDAEEDNGNKLPRELPVLAGAAMGTQLAGWNSAPVEMDFYFVKGVLETLFAELGIDGAKFVPESRNPSFHPGRTARVIVNGQELGIMGEIHPDVLENYELSAKVVAFEMDLVELLNVSVPEKAYTRLPRYPGVERDLAVVVEESVPVKDVLETVKEAGGGLLKEIELFDVYTGKQVPEGHKSLAFRLRFQADDRTLKDEEVNTRIEAVVNALKKKMAAEMR